MKVVLLESPARDIAMGGGSIRAEPGIPVEVPDELGERLLEQDVWGKKPKAGPAADAASPQED